MSPITHFLASWTLAEGSGLDRRERAIVTWAGLAPDLDGLGLLWDWASARAGWEVPGYYHRFHHQLLHGLPGAVLLAVVGAGLSRQRPKTFLWVLAAVHLHLLCDLVGSRGPAPTDLWPIHYLAPLSGALDWTWRGQWPLNGWPNLVLTMALMAFATWRAACRQRSPFQLFSAQAHQAFVGLVQRWTRRPGGGSSPGH